MQPKRLAIWSIALAIAGPVLAIGLGFLVAVFSPRLIPIKGIAFLVEAALFGIPPLLALLLGLVAIRKMDRLETPAPGKRIAITGLVMGALAALLACLAVPRAISMRDTMERARCCYNHRAHSDGKDRWAYEHKATNGTPVSLEELKPYFKCYNYGHCPARPWVEYEIGRIGEPVHCPIHGNWE
jgi:hypothetical protein